MNCFNFSYFLIQCNRSIYSFFSSLLASCSQDMYLLWKKYSSDLIILWWEDFFSSAYKNTWRGCKEDIAKIVLVVSCDTTSSNQHKMQHRMHILSTKKCIHAVLWQHWHRLPETVKSPPWRSSKGAWCGPGHPALGVSTRAGAGPDEPRCSLSASVILWFSHFWVHWKVSALLHFCTICVSPPNVLILYLAPHCSIWYLCMT